MSDLDESTGPKAHARIVYLGPVSPHWEVYGDWGDRQTLDEFRARVLARLVLLPREDPQFRRNRERIVRDAEREMISIEWDLGVVVQQTSATSNVDSEAVIEPSTTEPAVEIETHDGDIPTVESSETSSTD
ncbi:MAG: hypothetical protein P8O03_01160 [Ilumatobacter sp.]|nr:hypothetical protein [Ilumatobacter sp.]MDG2040455.1 hypothetical protein [Ilumatobacter sp.]